MSIPVPGDPLESYQISLSIGSDRWKSHRGSKSELRHVI
jgi:hypothetical protein